MKSSQKQLIEEFTEKDMEVLKKINENYSDDIEMTISKNEQGEYDFNITFSDQSPHEIATFFKQVLDAGIETIIQMALIKLGNKNQTMLENVVENYNKMIQKSQRHNDQLIVEPYQVFTGGNK